MKKTLYIIISLLLSISLVSCHNDDKKDLEKIVVAASPKPHAEILEFAKDLLAEKGYDLEIRVFSDYIMPNQALTLNQVDANFFQHEPYLDSYNKDFDTNIVSVAKIHIEPIGIYSKTYKNLDEVKNGATVAISKSKSDHGRLLNLLVNAKLITLKDGVEPFKATLEDIDQNPENLQIRADIDPQSLVQAYLYDQADLILINSNFALDANINPGTEAIILESATNNPFANIIATLEENLNSDKINALVEVLTSDKVKEFILTKWNNDIVPA